MTLHGTAGSVTVTGDTFAAYLGLPSDWFGVLDQVTGAQGGDNGYWILSSDERGVRAGRSAPRSVRWRTSPTMRRSSGCRSPPIQNGYWEVATDGGIFS